MSVVAHGPVVASDAGEDGVVAPVEAHADGLPDVRRVAARVDGPTRGRYGAHREPGSP